MRIKDQTPKNETISRKQHSVEEANGKSDSFDRAAISPTTIGNARLASGLLSPTEVVRLNGKIGNRAVCQLLARSGVCQRQETDEEEETVQAKSATDVAALQRKEFTGGGQLPSSLKTGLEMLSGQDLSHVRVHPNDAGPARLNALAYAQGGNIHLGPGQEKHLPHEGWHVVQQMQGRVQAGVSEGNVSINDDPALEREADVMGEKASHLGKTADGRGEKDLPFQAMTIAQVRCDQPIQRLDQHAGAGIPTAGTQSRIHGELYPARGASGAPPQPWDGLLTNPLDFAAVIRVAQNRARLIRAMHRAMNADLAASMPAIRATAARRRVPIASLEGAGRAAKADVDAKFGSYATAAALSTSQAAARAAYAISASGPGQNLYDAQNPVDRTTVGMGIDPTDLASWMAETLPGCVTARNTHHLDPTRSTEERTFLRTQIIAPFVAVNTPALRLYDLHGFAMSNPATGQIVLPTSVPAGLSDVAPGSGGLSPAERGRRWRAWRTMVHEYIHQLEHPALRAWPGRNRTLYEGFCEYFTKKVLLPLLPRRAGRDVTRRTLIEGANYGAPSAAIIGGAYNAGSYAGYLQHVENIERYLGGAAIGAQNAMKAIFFQGHLEYLGYDTSGSALTAPAGSRDEITVPTSLTTFAALATALNISQRRLRRANSGKTEPLSGRLHAPGCREHRVVIAGGRGSGAQAETLAVIATQHGVTQAAIRTANPGLNFSTLTEGSVVIIPRP